MPNLDVSELDFMQAMALVVVAIVMRSTVEYISDQGKRKRIAADLDTVERLSRLDLTSPEQALVESFRKGIVRDLPVRNASERLEFKPFDLCLCLWIAITLALMALGGSWVASAASMIALGALGLFGNACYEIGASNGRLRQREDLITEKRVENEYDRKVHDRKKDGRPEDPLV